jgi:hypothetical protein
MHNLIIGEPYIDIDGKAEVLNHTTSEKCLLEFKQRKWGGRNAFEVEGTIFSASGQKVWKLSGKWNEGIEIKNIQSGEVKTIWRMTKRPEQWTYLYYFTEYALQLNFLTPEIKEHLPPTDTRLRPD